MKNWQGIPSTRLTLGGEVMVPRDNSTLAFSTELLNYIRLRLHGAIYRPDSFVTDATLLCKFENDKI